MLNRIFKVLTGKGATPSGSIPAAVADSPEFARLNELAPVANKGGTQQASHEHGADFIESLERFVADWKAGLEAGTSRALASPPQVCDCMPWFG